jgi:SAM-dependent methyltransferase
MFTKYDFGYSWIVGYGAAIPLALALLVGAMAVVRHWSLWIKALAGIAALWSLVALGVVNAVWGINRPVAIPDTFLASRAGRVLDLGAGSGRAAIGVLLARPATRVTGVDLYSGYFGIDDNTPERFMLNARIAGVADRADARAGDMRQLPFGDETFDALISSYAIDHLNREGRAEALAEAARVLKPGGEFLLMIVDVKWWTLLVNPPLAHHPRVNVERWRGELDRAGFVADTEGTSPLTRYWVARKRAQLSQSLTKAGQ